MEDALTAIVDSITALMLVYDEAEAKSTTKMALKDTSDIVRVISTLIVIGYPIHPSLFELII
jgi:hypothetical protein